MKYKLIAVDMDGTLLNSEGKITDYTCEMVKRAQDLGVIFTISTGRPVQGVKKYCEELKLTGPVITYNGGMIVNALTNDVLYEQTLLKEDAKKIIELGEKYDILMCIWLDNKLYVNKLNDLADKYSYLSTVKCTLITDYNSILDKNITKILWYDIPERINDIQSEIDGSIFKEVTYCTSQPIFLEFFSSKVSKAKAMEKLGELYNIRQEEMIAIGDGLNDLSMIEYAGLGVSMANGHEEIKQIANYITTSNDDNGVGNVIKKFILEKE